MLICHIITGLTDGGAEAVLYRLCKNDTRNEHIVISLSDFGKYGVLLENIGVTVCELNIKTNIIVGFWKLFKLIRCYRPDIVQTWMYHADLIGGVVSRLAGVKKVVWGVHHTNLVKGESKKTTIMVAKLNAFLSRYIPSKIIYCADKSREAQESIGFVKYKGVVVYNGYEVMNYYPDLTLRALVRDQIQADNNFIIGNVGRFNPQKDHRNFILALSFVLTKFKNIKILLVGTGLDASNSELEHLLEELGISEKFLLMGRRDDINAIMNGLDLHVLSSSFGEAFPNVLNEAMSCGIPCVTTDIGDASLIVANAGWIVPPKNSQALAEAIIEAIKEKEIMPDVWNSRKAICRERIIQNFSIDKMVDSYNKVWLS